MSLRTKKSSFQSQSQLAVSLISNTLRLRLRLDINTEAVFLSAHTRLYYHLQAEPEASRYGSPV